MKSKILSLNVGVPAPMEWNGQRVLSSMCKSPVEKLTVGLYQIEGDIFASPNVHGTHDSVLYVLGIKSAMEYMRMFGRENYAAGTLGENISADDFDEKLVSVGDVFRIGGVVAQATFPRIPCAKVNLRMQHAQAQNYLRDVGKSGVYMRILEPGLVHPSDVVERIEEARVKFTIYDIYAKAGKNIALSEEERLRALSNGAFPAKMLEKWRTLTL